MPTTGQFWYLTQGTAADSRLVYIDINASSASGGSNSGGAPNIFVDDTPTIDLQTTFPEDVQIDWAAGVYFVLVNANPTLGSGGEVLMGHLNSSAAPVVVYTAPVNDVVNTLQLDVYSHHLYVQHADANLATGSTGILDFTYAPAAVTPLSLTAVATNGGYLVRSSGESGIPNNATVGNRPVFDPRDFALDHTTNTLFFVNETDGFVNTNEIYRLNLASPNTITPLLQQSQFPVSADGSGTAFSGGYITSVEVDPTTDLVYFTTHSQHPSPDGTYNAALNKIYWISETASGSTAATALTITGLPAGNHFYPGKITFDLATREIYVVSEETDTGGVVVKDDVVYVLQLSADGHSASLLNTIAPSPAFQTDASNFAGLTFDDLAQLGTLSPVATHAVEQGANLGLLLAAPTITDADGDHLNNATVKITGGTFSSNENSTADDHLGFAAANVSGSTINGTSITFSYDAATETLTLTGYDTLVHYQTALSEVVYFTTGDNPTNYGANTTRTVTWQVNDGAVGNPSGTVNGTSTNVRTSTINIDAVNDAPVNHLPGTSPTGNEDATFAITGVSVSDPDADPTDHVGNTAINQNLIVALSVAHGTLTVGSVADGSVVGSASATVTLTGTQASINAALASLQYTSNSNFNGIDQLTITTNDQGNTGLGGAQQTTTSVNINVTAVNDPVTAAAPASATLAEDASVAITGLSIADVDATLAPNGVYAVTLSDAHGALTLGTTTNLTFDGGTANGTATLTFHGKLADINTALATASYAGAANYNGADTIVFSVTDTFGGTVATGTGSATSDSKNIAVTVTAVNDPVTAAAPASATLAEDASVAITGLSIADVDATLAPNGVYAVTLSDAHGALTLGTTANLTFDGGTANGTATLTFHGKLADINTALATASYAGAANYNGADTIVFSVTDTFGGILATGTGTPTSDSKNVSVTVTAVDDLPTNTVPGAQSTSPNGVITFSGSISVADLDVNETAPPNNTVQVKLEVAGAGATITLAAGSGVAVDAGADGSSTVTFHGTLTQVNAALDGLKYTAGAVGGGDTLTITTDDLGHTGSGPHPGVVSTVAINVISPVTLDLDADNSSGATGNDYATVFTLAQVAVADTDIVVSSATQLTTATVSITGNYQSTEDVLSFTDTANITTVSNTGGVLTLTSANATAAEWAAALATVKYADGNGTPNTANRTIDVVIGDGTSSSPAAHTTVYFHGVDLNGGAAGFDDTASFVEPGPVLIAPAAMISGADNLLTMTITLAATPDGVAESLGLNSAAAALAATAGMTVTPGAGSLTITGPAPLLSFQAVLEGVEYLNSSDNPTPTARIATVTVTDIAGHSSVAHTSTVSVAPSNDPPTAVADTGVAGENEIKSFDVLANDTDPDNGDTKTLASIDNVALVVSANSDVNNIDASGAFSIVGNQIKFTPGTLFDHLDFDDTASVVVSYTMHDSANVTSSSTLTLTVNGANDPPVANPDTGFAGENETKLFDVLPNDTDVDTGDTKTLDTTLGAITVTSANGDVNNINAVGAFSVVGSQIQFSPGALFDKLDFNDTATVVVNYTMHDSQGAPASSMLTLTVNGANDAPVANPDAGSAGENETKSFDVVANDTDVDTGDTKTLDGTLVADLVTSANLDVNNIDASSAFSVVGNQIVFTPGALFDHLAVGQTAQVVVHYTMHDSQNVSSSSTLTLTVNGANDAPVLTNVAPSAAWPPGAAPVLLSPGTLPSPLHITDVDNTDLANTGFVGAIVKLTNSTLLGDTLAVDLPSPGGVFTGTNISASYNPGSFTLTLSGTDTLANYEFVLQHVTFTSTNLNPTSGGGSATRTVSWQLDDGSAVNNLSNVVTSEIRLHTLDLDTAAPGTDYATTFTEHGASVAVAGNVFINDADSANMSKAVVTLANPKTADSLLVSDTVALAGLGISISPSSTATSIILTGVASAANYQQALDLIVFTNASSNPDTALRDITIVITDTLATPVDTNTAHTIVSIIPVNDAPVVNSGSASLSYIENQAATAIDPGLNLTDPDSPNLVSATIAITANFHSGQDVLGFVNQNGITGSYNAIAGILTLNGVSSILNYEAALQSVSYFNSSDAPSADLRTVSYTVDDGSLVNHASSPGDATVAVVPVNDAPLLGGVPAAAAFTNGAAVVLAPGLTISDPDSSTLTSATVHVGAGAFTGHGDVLSISAGGLAGTGISASYDAATETLTLTGTDTLAHYQQALESVAFQTTNFGIDRAQTIEWQLNDGAASNNLSVVQTTAISLPHPPINDLNGNGHSDILWQTDGGLLAGWEMNGVQISFADYFKLGQSNAGLPGPDWHVVDTGDFDGDGRSDLLWRTDSGALTVWEMDGTHIKAADFTKIGATNVGAPGPDWHLLGAADFDGDGKSDLLWRTDGGALAIWEMNGTQIKGADYVKLGAANVGVPGPDWHVIGVSDFDGDGKSDLLWRTDSGALAIWEMDGTQIKAADYIKIGGSNVGAPGADWHMIGTGDFDGDGKSDLLWQTDSGALAIWEMNGTQIKAADYLKVGSTNVGVPAPDWHFAGTSDYDGDGKNDLLWRTDDGHLAVWEMNGVQVSLADYIKSGSTNVGAPGADWHIFQHHYDII